MQSYREFATLAATCAQSPEGLRLVAYSLGKTTEYGFVDMPTVVRRSRVDALMGALRGAALRVAGVSNPDAHAKLITLIDQDDAATTARRERGGW